MPAVMGWGYAYDTPSIHENTGRVAFAYNLYDDTLDRSYDYDHVGRLGASHTGTEGRGHAGYAAWGPPDGPYAENYSFDQWGNTVWRNGWGAPNTQYSFNPAISNNRITVNPINGAAMQYDAAGNLTNDGTQVFFYDATGQQTFASGTTLTQSYDGDGVRAKKTEAGVVTYYLRSSVLGKQVMGEMNGSGLWIRGYVYLGGQMVAIQQNLSVQWVHQDPITKSQRLTNSAGSVVSTIDLDPWGGETGRSSNQALQPHRFTSYERDGNGGDDAMFRRHEQKWQRFAQPDPSDGSYDLTDPQSLNRYSYVQNDPVNFVDPSGLLRAQMCGLFSIGTGDGVQYGLVCFGDFHPWDGYEPKEPEAPKTPYVDLDVLNYCTEKLFGVTTAAFSPSQKGHDGSFTGYGKDYPSKKGDYAMMTVVNDARTHSSTALSVMNAAVSVAAGYPPPPSGGRRILGWTDPRDPYTNFTANNLGRLSKVPLSGIRTQVHELGHSLSLITKQLRYQGEQGELLENCVDDYGGFLQ